jgi:very-short-patch-repair endonuclease
MRHQPVPDRQIAEIAGRQGGVIEHAQLRACGLSASGIHRRVRAGRLHPLFRGVYAVGHRAVGPVGRRWAAVLACGDGAVLSHVAAGAAWGMRPTSSGVFDITVARGGRARRRGLRIHTATLLPDDEITRLDGLPITTPARTLLDLAAAPVRNLDTLLDRAEQQRLISFDQLHALLERYPGRPGTRSLKAQLARYRGPVDVRSELERLVYQVCDAHGLPRPQVNCVIEGKVRDLYWPACRLVVEADSYAWHRSPAALNADRERDVELTLAGYCVLRFTWEQVTQRPEYVVRAIRAALYELMPRIGTNSY